jgi:hypothetical protein
MSTFTSRNRNNTNTDEGSSPFKMMFVLTSIMVALVFVVAAVLLILTFTGNLPFSYNYEVTQTWGETTYHQEYSTE